MWWTARKPGVRFVHPLLWKHFPNSIRLLWTFVKGWPVWIKENKQPHPHFNFWSLNGSCQYRDEDSQLGRRQSLGGTSSQQMAHTQGAAIWGHRALGQFTASRDANGSSTTAFLLSGAGLHRQLHLGVTRFQQDLLIHGWWSGLPSAFSSSTALLLVKDCVRHVLDMLQERHQKLGLGAMALR